MYKDILYNILMHCDSFTLKRLSVVNKTTQIIFNDQHFWLTKFNYYKIPKINLTFKGFRDYEKAYHIVKNIMILFNCLDIKQYCATININKTIPYLNNNIQTKINDFILKNNFTGQTIGLNAVVNSSLNEDDINQLRILILTSKENDIIDKDGITYLPSILTSNKTTLSDTLQYRYDFWQDKVWYI